MSKPDIRGPSTGTDSNIGSGLRVRDRRPPAVSRVGPLMRVSEATRGRDSASESAAVAGGELSGPGAASPRVGIRGGGAPRHHDKALVRYCGVPHREVDLLMVPGGSVDFALQAPRRPAGERLPRVRGLRHCGAHEGADGAVAGRCAFWSTRTLHRWHLCCACADWTLPMLACCRATATRTLGWWRRRRE